MFVDLFHLIVEMYLEHSVCRRENGPPVHNNAPHTLQWTCTQIVLFVNKQFNRDNSAAFDSSISHLLKAGESAAVVSCAVNCPFAVSRWLYAVFPSNSSVQQTNDCVSHANWYLRLISQHESFGIGAWEINFGDENQLFHFSRVFFPRNDPWYYSANHTISPLVSITFHWTNLYVVAIDCRTQTVA